MEKIMLNFNETEKIFLTNALLKRVPTPFIKFEALIMDLYKRVYLEEASYERDELFILFNSLLVMDRKELFDAYKHITESSQSYVELEKVASMLLNRLWSESNDRRKEEALWSMSFRDLLDSWSIPYSEDMIRIGVPKNIENEDDEK